MALSLQLVNANVLFEQMGCKSSKIAINNNRPKTGVLAISCPGIPEDEWEVIPPRFIRKPKEPVPQYGLARFRTTLEKDKPVRVPDGPPVEVMIAYRVPKRKTRITIDPFDDGTDYEVNTMVFHVPDNNRDLREMLQYMARFR